MIVRIRLLLALVRPAVAVLLGLFAATGLAQAGRSDDPVLLAEVLVVVMTFLVFAVVVNDLADEAIDRVNLPADTSRPLVGDASSRRELAATGAVAGVLALMAAIALDVLAGLVVAGGMALTLAYSLRPIRLADRGAVASMLLPAGYVGVPYLVGILTVRPAVTGQDLVLLGGLYVGFIGRILLKDFRDVRGDALFGKRTFLVRHGRRRTCATSAVCWVAGAACLVGVRGVTVALAAGYGVLVLIALGLLQRLAVERSARRDEALIAAIALVGRGMVVMLLAHLGMTDAGWPVAGSSAAVGILVLVVAGSAVEMARLGPRTMLRIPDSWVTSRAAEPVGSGRL